MKTVPLSQGYFAIIDDQDFARVSRFKWYAKVMRRKDGSVRNVYAAQNVRRDGERTTEKLHRFIMGVTDPKIQIDHIDGTGTNCQRSNLRIATITENNRNVRLRVNSTTGLKGVTFHKQRGKFGAQIKGDGKHRYLGLFASKYAAALAYDEAALELHGDFALTNQMLGLLPKHRAGVTVQLPLQLEEAMA